MDVLALNCGSSSVKFQLIATGAPGGERRRARGLIDRLGRGAIMRLEVDGKTVSAPAAQAADAGTGVTEAIAAVREAGLGIDAVGHRVVHGGSRFTTPTLLDADVVAAIDALAELAPLHNEPSLGGIRAARSALGRDIPMVAVFDTAFHAGLPERAAWYAIPYALALKHGIRRYGFHGLSYRSVLGRYAELRGTPANGVTVVAFHLGNGASAAAIKDGVCVDTSMGFTPLEGLVMGTRSGDLDPSLVVYLAEREGVPAAEIERMLNRESGLLGLGGRADMRELLLAAPTDDRARRAIDVFCHRARKYLGAYLAVLGGADAVLFTGGIGEHAAEVRARICDDMQWCGVVLDEARNAAANGREGEVSAPGSRIQVWVIPTDEELVIARDTASVVQHANRR
jgi:acetate kinase